LLNIFCTDKLKLEARVQKKTTGESPMLAKEEKLLLQKVTVAVGTLLEKALIRYTNKEIAALLQVPSTRLTEYKNFEKYQRSIPVTHLVKLLGEGLFTIEDIISTAGAGLSKKEKRYLRDMNFYENTELRKMIVQNKNDGMDPVEIHSILRELKDAGIDPMQILRRAKENI
jgi:hypothetical protein